jgi:hypothetical protein
MVFHRGRFAMYGGTGGEAFGSSTWPLQHFSVLGTPPVVTYEPPPVEPNYSQALILVSDGNELIGATSQAGTEVIGFDRDDGVSWRFLAPGSVDNPTGGLALRQTTWLASWWVETNGPGSSYGKVVGLFDLDRRQIGTPEPVRNPFTRSFAATAYGCGLAWVEGSETTSGTQTDPLRAHLIPLWDGARTDMDIANQYATPDVAEWPWDSRAIAMDWRLDGGVCGTRLHVVGEGNRDGIDRTYPSQGCRFRPRLVTTIFGAVLFQPDGSLQLLGADGEALGAPVPLSISVYSDGVPDSHVAIASDGTNVLVVWQSSATGLMAAVASCGH